ncbi:hypothetical protein V3390_02090 [Luteimonas sp. FXH3W]|uniref:Uncharacterized protein n=1 Tax=Aquilutibacter rugosus TaxID=3115820 RepID=A0ABU7UY62_9GAMM
MKTPKNRGTEWKPAEVIKLKVLAVGNHSTRVIGLKLQRMPTAIQGKESSGGISLSRLINRLKTAGSKSRRPKDGPPSSTEFPERELANANTAMP